MSEQLIRYNMGTVGSPAYTLTRTIVGGAYQLLKNCCCPDTSAPCTCPDTVCSTMMLDFDFMVITYIDHDGLSNCTGVISTRCPNPPAPGDPGDTTTHEHQQWQLAKGSGCTWTGTYLGDPGDNLCGITAITLFQKTDAPCGWVLDVEGDSWGEQTITSFTGATPDAGTYPDQEICTPHASASTSNHTSMTNIVLACSGGSIPQAGQRRTMIPTNSPPPPEEANSFLHEANHVQDELLGDIVARWSKEVGADKVAKWLEYATGLPCGCGWRQRALNKLHAWGRMLIKSVEIEEEPTSLPTPPVSSLDDPSNVTPQA